MIIVEGHTVSTFASSRKHGTHLTRVQTHVYASNQISLSRTPKKDQNLNTLDSLRFLVCNTHTANFL